MCEPVRTHLDSLEKKKEKNKLKLNVYCVGLFALGNTPVCLSSYL